MSLAAFLLVLVAVATGSDKGAKDEGSAAHIFHVLMALQITVHSDFLDDGRLEAVLSSCWRSKLQVAAVALAFAPVRFFQAVTAASCHCRSLDGDALLLPQPRNLGIIGGVSSADGAVQFGTVLGDARGDWMARGPLCAPSGRASATNRAGRSARLNRS